MRTSEPATPNVILSVMHEFHPRGTLTAWFEETQEHLQNIFFQELSKFAKNKGGVRIYLKKALTRRKRHLMLCPACPFFGVCYIGQDQPKTPNASPLSIQLCYGCSSYIVSGDYRVQGRYFTRNDWPFPACPFLSRERPKERIKCNHVSSDPQGFNLDTYIDSEGSNPTAPYKSSGILPFEFLYGEKKSLRNRPSSI